MLISRNREKLINAVVYFASNTRHCGKVKLFKLLYLLDFAHFRETGRSVTGLDYRAWKMGPVPFELMQEWDELESDMALAINIVPEGAIDFIRERVVPKVAFDDSLFTRRELRLMREISTNFVNELTKTSRAHARGTGALGQNLGWRQGKQRIDPLHTGHSRLRSQS